MNFKFTNQLDRVIELLEINARLQAGILGLSEQQIEDILLNKAYIQQKKRPFEDLQLSENVSEEQLLEEEDKEIQEIINTRFDSDDDENQFFDEDRISDIREAINET